MTECGGLSSSCQQLDNLHKDHYAINLGDYPRLGQASPEMQNLLGFLDFIPQGSSGRQFGQIVSDGLAKQNLQNLQNLEQLNPGMQNLLGFLDFVPQGRSGQQFGRIVSDGLKGKNLQNLHNQVLII